MLGFVSAVGLCERRPGSVITVTMRSGGVLVLLSLVTVQPASRPAAMARPGPAVPSYPTPSSLPGRGFYSIMSTYRTYEPPAICGFSCVMPEINCQKRFIVLSPTHDRAVNISFCAITWFMSFVPVARTPAVSIS